MPAKKKAKPKAHKVTVKVKPVPPERMVPVHPDTPEPIKAMAESIQTGKVDSIVFKASVEPTLLQKIKDWWAEWTGSTVTIYRDGKD